jgi:hypothetical protein
MYKLILLSVLSLQFLYGQCYDKNTFTNNDIAKTLKCLQDEINQLKNLKNKNKSNKTQNFISQNFNFDLTQCTRNSNQVVCEISVKNLAKKDRKFYFDKFYAYDEKGKNYKSWETYIQDENGRKPHTMINEIPVKTTLVISKFDSNANILKALKINTNAGVIEFRDIAIK